MRLIFRTFSDMHILSMLLPLNVLQIVYMEIIYGNRCATVYKTVLQFAMIFYINKL